MYIVAPGVLHENAVSQANYAAQSVLILFLYPRGATLFTWTSRNSLACRTSAALAGSMWRSAATDMAIPSTSVTGSLPRPCTQKHMFPA